MPASSSAPHDADAILTRRLANGLTVHVVQEPAVPNIAYFTGWRVGSRNERPGITGMSHLFEHMMFNGAKRHGPKMFDRILESNGGFSNAYTTRDLTAYYEVVPSEKLGVVLDLEVDRMEHLELSERNLESEREVVKEERRLRTDESPIGTLLEHLQATAYTVHPYRWPVIGWMEDLDAITVQDIRDFFAVHYSPANAVVTACGDLEGERSLDAIEAVLGELPGGPSQPAVDAREPEQQGERRIDVERPSRLNLVAVGWHVGDAASPDLPVLDVLQALLGDGDSSRLRRRLVLERDLAVDVHVDYPWSLDPGLLIIALTARPDVPAERCEEALLAELDALTSSPPTARELRKAKNVLKADFYRRMKTNEGRADTICNSELTFGSPTTAFELPERYEAVTTEQVCQVAARTFRATNRTVAVMRARSAGDGR